MCWCKISLVNSFFPAAWKNNRIMLCFACVFKPAAIDPVVECLPASGGARSDLVNNLVSTSAGTVSVIEVLLFKMQHCC
jgi:hypothetical protein